MQYDPSIDDIQDTKNLGSLAYISALPAKLECGLACIAGY